MHTNTRPSRLLTHVNRFMIGILVFGAIAGFDSSAEKLDVVTIVLSSDSKPYTQAADACEEKLSGSGIRVERVMLNELSTGEIAQISGAVVAIGGRSSRSLMTDLPPAIPLYYCLVPGPDLIGLSTRSNTSGVSSDTDLTKQTELMQGGLDGLRRVGALYRSSSASSSDRIRAMRDAMPAGIELVTVDLDAKNSAHDGIKDLLKMKIDIVWTIADPAVYNSAVVKTLLLESIRVRIPVFGFSHSLVRAGATFGVGIDPSVQGSRTAELFLSGATDQHLGAAPSLAVNQIVAERIRIELAGSFVRSADVVFRDE